MGTLLRALRTVHLLQVNRDPHMSFVVRLQGDWSVWLLGSYFIFENFRIETLEVSAAVESG